ncbi:tail fiber domain-containing protein [Pyxidicoccus trucidator]|uniref:tail fiber domain-containing protein n=1 Tax=Pyxidicoccus trucidator TaxID=2709662 RepID=UPI0013DCB7DA|nr:tail fiber domain-containing protein [Pyxidicoccus trucidator]
MSDPFYPAKSGDPILADMWNNMQIKLRDEVRTHTHRGADDGKQLDGDSIVPTASLKVNRVDASVALTVKSIDVLTRLTELGTSITGLGNTKLNVTGGGITGALTVTGNLGVGTTAPGSKLDIQGNTRTGTHGSNRTLYVTGDFAADDGVEFRHSNGTQGVGLGHNTVYATGSNADQDLNLKARGAGSVRVTRGALVPTVGNAPTAGIQFPSDPGGGSGDQAFIRYYVISGETTKLMIGCDNDPDDSIGLWQSGAERLTVINGRVGIGTTDPQGALDVRIPGAPAGWDRLVVTATANWGNGNSHVTLGAGGAAGGAAGIMFNNPHVSWMASEARASMRYGISGGVPAGRWWDVGVRTSGAFSMALENSYQAMWLSPDGNVGLGTNGPQAPLHVQQRGVAGIRLQEHNNTGRFLNILYEGQGTAVFYHQNGQGYYMPQDGSWNRNSDVSLKENIASIGGVLERVLALQPVSFDWKATGTRSIGLVAQAVEPLFPELVAEAEPEPGRRIKSISYDTIGVLAVAAIQELKRQYDEKLRTLEERIQALTAR